MAEVTSNHCYECDGDNTRAVSYNGRETVYECLYCKARGQRTPPWLWGDY